METSILKTIRSMLDMDPDEEGEVPYYKVGGMLHIELHKELFSSESEAYGELNNMFTYAFQKKIQTEIHGVPVYTCLLYTSRCV